MIVVQCIERLFQELALVTWLGGLVYVCFVLPPLPDQGALPPVYVRMMGLVRFRVFNAACLAVLTLAGVVDLAFALKGPGPWCIAGAVLRLLLLGACGFSSWQLQQLLARAMAGGHMDPLPAICQEDPTQVDKLLRQVNKVCRSLVFCGLAFLVIQVLSQVLCPAS